MSRRDALAGRLARLKKDGLSPPVKKTHGKVINQPFKLSHLDGWSEISPYVWKKTVSYENPLNEVYPQSLLLPQETRSDNLIFYDTETTGLSTGAGTIPFLIGIGCVNDRRFEITQLFLADYPGEIHLLEELNRLFREDAVFVSYNGKTYDSHLINTRFLMNGLRVKKRQEVDLLYTSRRLWKNILDNCRLGTIEKEIMSITRGPDIPGAEIPDVWFDFLKTGDTEKLERVFSHNLQDIYSLSLLLHQIEEIIEGKASHLSYDRFSLGRTLLFHNRHEGINLLQQELDRGNRKAGEFLSLYWKRHGEWDKSVAIWQRMNHRGYHYFSVEELAKFYEHKAKDYREALKYIDKILKGPVPPAQEIREKLIHRKKRLLLKLEKEV
ncbi:ribonuclease H-like domain-containing protein [Spirochaeta isovalerica]|uniref:YprB ribonuclease H-like domain-containing protein n=1 Tax=Spirochaeta isovalerica TaxID=150 RepID=A0A841R6R8_9SPIO|nr:ribonuclease H-like domain-containing protein [Spirochaeta isovalerica]MBB6478679.1 hypothetical protein [Spirochaeta isovalerica]